LIEWPERLGGYLPLQRLDVTLSFRTNVGARHVELSAGAAWGDRVEQLCNG
jgi:tRNA A37 threonylcarbamoyladenosine biosynthesis protein TsaE